MNDNVYNIGERRRAQGQPERPLSDTVNDAVREFRVFIETRIAMLRMEMREKAANLKFAAPLIVAGVLFGGTAWLLLTGAVVAVLAVAFEGSVYGPFLALLIVGVCYAIVGAAALWMAKGRIGKKGIVPERTLNVLKEDKMWLENEARTQL